MADVIPTMVLPFPKGGRIFFSYHVGGAVFKSFIYRRPGVPDLSVIPADGGELDGTIDIGTPDQVQGPYHDWTLRIDNDTNQEQNVIYSFKMTQDDAVLYSVASDTPLVLASREPKSISGSLFINL